MILNELNFCDKKKIMSMNLIQVYCCYENMNFYKYFLFKSGTVGPVDVIVAKHIISSNVT